MRPSDRSRPRILVVAPEPDQVTPVIAARVPGAEVHVCTDYGALAGALEAVRPQIVYAFKIGRRPFPRDALFAAPSVAWVQNSGAGVDHLVPWDAAQVTVTNASGVHGELMAQYTAWAILNHRLGLPVYARRQGEQVWEKGRFHSVRGQTLAIVGFGRIGGEIGRVARALGLHVIGVRTRPEPSDHADEVVGADALHAALGRADYVSVVLPMTEGNRGLIGERAIAAMKPGAYLINTGRGGIVDETALLAALRAGHLSGATLDVFATEPLPAEDPLWSAPGVTILPHITGDPADWKRRVTEMFCDNLENWMAGHPLFNTVDPDRGY
ncbi:D-2-hydroxyacid dehydrogenase [Rhodobacteraceae bacterium CCMM004]|nr:D-2-hydroxyacid dehydrogenase [Rhodobacteraceae bacterium CCMM004]